MKKFKPIKNYYPISIFFFLLLSSCSTTYKVGKAFNVENIAKIKIGVTTEADALKFFGKPLRIGALNGNTILVYAKEDITFTVNDDVERKGNTLVLEFDTNKVLKNYYWNVPGKDFVLLKYLFDKRNKEKAEENRQANSQNNNLVVNNGVHR